MNATISLCMIVKNEEKNIRRCLSSVTGAVDEIIVVDTGSTDSTCSLAEKLGAKVHHHPWNDNFAEARNASVELATGEWILFLDADEELPEGGGVELRKLVNTDGVEGYFIKIINYLGNEGWIEPCPDLVFRLFRNRRDYRFRGAIHEQIADVILEKNAQAGYRIAGNLEIIHYGYLDDQIDDKDKKARNIGIIKRELESDPGNRLLRYHYGVELYRAGKYVEAASELIAAARGIDPQTIYLPKLVRYIVLSYHAANMPEQAMMIIQSGLRLFPNYADLYYYAGLTAYDQKKYSDAYEYFQKAVSMPEQPPYYAPFYGIRSFRSHYYLGRLAEVFLNEDKALQYYVASLRDNPSFMPALESIVRILKPEENPESAGPCLEKICDFCTPQANLTMGKILFRQSAFQLALEYLDRYTQQQEAPPEVLMWKAICLLQQKRSLEALKILDGFDPSHALYPLARLNKILYLWFQGNRRKMRPLVEELFSLGLSPDTGAIVTLLQDSLNKRRKPKVNLGNEGMLLLLDILQRSLDLGERERVSLLLLGLTKECLQENGHFIGRLFFRYGCFAEAGLYYSLFLEANTNDLSTIAMLAQSEERLGNSMAAVGLYKKIMELDPMEPGHYIRLIGLYEKMRLDILREAVNRYPGVPVFSTLLEEGRHLS